MGRKSIRIAPILNPTPSLVPAEPSSSDSMRNAACRARNRVLIWVVVAVQVFVEEVERLSPGKFLFFKIILILV